MNGERGEAAEVGNGGGGNHPQKSAASCQGDRGHGLYGVEISEAHRVNWFVPAMQLRT